MLTSILIGGMMWKTNFRIKAPDEEVVKPCIVQSEFGFIVKESKETV